MAPGSDPLVVSILHLGLALGLGALIGIERRLRGHPAGIHTNALVALGSAAFVIAGALISGDFSRVAAQVVTGSGFICGGVILHRGTDVRGLNTAATLWCASGVGVMCGVHQPLLGTAIAAFVLATNITLHYVEHVLIQPPSERS